MRTFFSPQAVLIAGLLLAAAGLALVGLGIFQIGKSVPQNFAQVQAMENHRTSQFWTVLGHSIKITDTLLVIFTFLLFVATALLWWSTTNLVRETEQHGERALCAYVSVVGGGMQVVNVTQGGQGIAIHVELKNSGQTPGYDFTTWIKPPQILSAGDTPFDSPTPINQRTGIGPGGSAHINWTIAASAADLADIQAGTKKVFVWGVTCH